MSPTRCYRGHVLKGLKANKKKEFLTYHNDMHIVMSCIGMVEDREGRRGDGVWV